MSEEEIISNIGEMLGTQRTYYPQELVIKISEKDKNTIINLLDKYLTLKKELSNTVPKQVIRDKIEELKKQFKDYEERWSKTARDKKHPFYKYLIRIEAEIDILNELLESEE